MLMVILPLPDHCVLTWRFSKLHLQAAASRRLSALDRHARFVKHLQRFRDQQLDVEQASCHCKARLNSFNLLGMTKHELCGDTAVQKQHGAQQAAAEKLRAFTKTLRQAILGGADVTSLWKPAETAATLKAMRQHWHSQEHAPEKSWASASAHGTRVRTSAVLTL